MAKLPILHWSPRHVACTMQLSSFMEQQNNSRPKTRPNLQSSKNKHPQHPPQIRGFHRCWPMTICNKMVQKLHHCCEFEYQEHFFRTQAADGGRLLWVQLHSSCSTQHPPAIQRASRSDAEALRQASARF